MSLRYASPFRLDVLAVPAETSRAPFCSHHPSPSAPPGKFCQLAGSDEIMQRWDGLCSPASDRGDLCQKDEAMNAIGANGGRLYKPWGGNWAFYAGATYKLNETTSFYLRLSR